MSGTLDFLAPGYESLYDEARLSLMETTMEQLKSENQTLKSDERRIARIEAENSRISAENRELKVSHKNILEELTACRLSAERSEAALTEIMSLLAAQPAATHGNKRIEKIGPGTWETRDL